MLNKPFGILSQHSDEGNRRGWGSLGLPFPSDAYSIGRLDADSEGLLLFTNNNRLKTGLLDPKEGHARTYHVQVEGEASPEQLAQLQAPMTLRIKGKSFTTQGCTARTITPSWPPRTPPIRVRKSVPDSWLELTPRTRAKQASSAHDSSRWPPHAATHSRGHGRLGTRRFGLGRMEGTVKQLHPMNIASWVLAPLKTLPAILHTALCSITGWIAMALSAHNGDWVMWRVGRQMWSRPLLQAILGAKLDIDVHPEAQALADRQQGVVLVANHTSLLDINAAFAASPTPIVFLSKASVRKVPLLGKLNELAGTVFVERGNRASSEKAVHQLTGTLKQGRSVLVFPEGTRSEDGTLRPFKKGAFHLAKLRKPPSCRCTSQGLGNA